jgi:Ca2+-binding RTX toxin-like protein
MAKKSNNGPQNEAWTINGFSFSGGNASDQLTVTGNGNSLFGENGTDTLSATGKNNNLDGGNGADVLSSSEGDQPYSWTETNNKLNGGRGDDIFYSSGKYATDVSGVAANMTGGQGMDTFVLRQSTDTLIHNAAGDSYVEEGHIIEGVFDLIQDYEAGELIDIGTTQRQTDPIAIFPTGGPDHQHLILQDDSYAFVHGTLTATGEFTVDDEGTDLLIVSDYDPAGEYWPDYGGAVVLIGVTDETTVNIGSVPV